MVETEPCDPPCSVSVSAPMVMQHSWIPGVILTEGLFPHNRRSLQVLAKSTWSPTGYGVRPLAPQEFWNLWDVPILLQDVADREPVFAGALFALMESAPAKILLSGAKCLLSSVLRGGDAGRKRRRCKEVGESFRSVKRPRGPGGRKEAVKYLGDKELITQRFLYLRPCARPAGSLN